MAAYQGDPLKLVVVGTITASGPAGVEVAVERWFQVNLCTPHARLDTPEGQSMTNEALAAFGSGAPPVGPPAGPEVAPTPDLLGPAAAVGAAVLLGLVVFGLVAALGRRRRVGD